MKKSTEFLLLVAVIMLSVIAIGKITEDRTTIINCNHPNREYAFDVVDDSIFVYTEDDKLVGGVKLQGQLDSLITADNE